WENFFDGSIAADVLSGREDAAGQSILDRVGNSLTRFAKQSKFACEVTLVGAGPGDPGLLTLRALRALQNADVILYDRLVSAEVLALPRRDAERIYVGKAAVSHHIPQEDTDSLLVMLANEATRVGRFEGGDPFIFGRGGEELDALAVE